MEQEEKSNSHKGGTYNQSDSLIVAPPANRKRQKETDTQNNDTSRSNQNGSKSRLSSVGIYIQIALALFTLGTLIVVCLQLRSFQKQTSILESQLVNQTRAWVTVKDASHQKIKKGEKITCIIKFINAGDSPALNLTIHNNFAIRNIPIPTPMQLIPLDSKLSCAVIGPQVIHQSIITGNVIMTEELIREIEQGNLHIYIWGIVKYDDIFSQQRQTGYCLKNKLGTTKFDVCENNNYAN